MSYYNTGGDNSLGGKIGGVLSATHTWLNEHVGMMVLIVLFLSGISFLMNIGLLATTKKSRFGQPDVGILDQRAAGPDKTRLDGANQGSGTFDAPLGTPEYSDEAAQVAAAQLAKAKSGFTSRFYSSRANGPSARYVPAYRAAPASGVAPAPPAASTERMRSQDARLAGAMGGQ
jgi:hypothetical protein